MHKKRKSKKRLKKIKKDLNLAIGSILFVLLIGSAFAVDWIFGMVFVVGFAISIYNKTLEKKPLIPIFLFLGGLIIRIALFLFIPRILGAENYFNLGIAIILFVVILFIGFRIKKGRI